MPRVPVLLLTAPLTAVVTVLLTACGRDATEPAPPVDPEPVLEYVVVEAAVEPDGLTTVGWTHPAGLSSLNGRPYSTQIIGPEETHGGTADTKRTRISGVIEYEYPWGRDAIQIVASHDDNTGRTATYDCFPPGWSCTKR